MKLPELIKKCLLEFSVPRYRDRRAYYASEALKCRRDLYWERTGVKKTDPIDFKGAMTMSLGKWIEEGILKYVFQNLHFFGLHFIGTQIQTGGSAPVPVDGNLDAMVCERIGDKFSKPVVVEVKTKHGYGADLLLRTLEISPDYLVQLGIYLKDLSEKNVTSEGVLLYVLLSDENFGEVVSFRVRFDPVTQTAEAYEVQFVTGESRPMSQTVSIKDALARLQVLDMAIAAKKQPSADYHYKALLTPEYLAACSENDLKKAVQGQKILGDWQARYSGYFTHALGVDKSEREYSAAELRLIAEEIQRRGLVPTRGAVKDAVLAALSGRGA